VDAVTRARARATVEEALAEGGPPLRVVAVNPEKVMVARESPELRAALDRAGLLIPDGIGVVWALRRRGASDVGRVTGVDFFVDIVEAAAASGASVFLLGGRPGVAERAADRLRQLVPAVHVAGVRHGYDPPERTPEVLDRIRESGAAVLGLALGSPAQERWMDAHLASLPAVRVCQGLGGTLDVLSGGVRRAPPAVQALGFEWLFRLVQEPARLRRQGRLPRFALSVLLERRASRPSGG
jgi:N-acetylglucosaminyldiphosphoundecaprenol N-acetyl-beta-D-mannosaminyltransferase